MSAVFLVAGVVFIAVACLLHVAIFALESVLWTRPAVFRRFGVKTAADAGTLRPMAFNQGFYNLFLALGGFVGLALLPVSKPIGLALCFFAASSMVLAAVVLVASSPKLARAAFIQGSAPLLGVGLLLLSVA